MGPGWPRALDRGAGRFGARPCRPPEPSPARAPGAGAAL